MERAKKVTTEEGYRIFLGIDPLEDSISVKEDEYKNS